TASAGPVTVNTPSPPAAPSALRAASITATRVDLAWQINSTDEAGFNVYRATGNGAFSQLGRVGARIASYSDPSVVGGVTYRYYVEAFNGNGAAASPTISATTPGNPAASIHVAALALTVQQIRAGGRLASRAFVTVTIRNGGNSAVSGARVTGRFTGAAAASVAASTSNSGTVGFYTAWRY